MGRCKERIPIVLKHIDWCDFILNSGYVDAYFKDLNHPGVISSGINLEANKIQEIAEFCKSQMNLIEDYWIKNPDQRLIQVLVNIGIIENVLGSWWNFEETEYFIKNHILKPEEILFWDTHGKRW